MNRGRKFVDGESLHYFNFGGNYICFIRLQEKEKIILCVGREFCTQFHFLVCGVEIAIGDRLVQLLEG